MRVPDDASDLEADRLAWVAEQRVRRRRARWRRLVLTRRWELVRSHRVRAGGGS